ncbi:cytochrome P450 [Myxococcota bacterium]|nr:cytochrome P450 [Myxococcota bacterium]
MSEPIVYNPFAYEIHEDPYPTYARMREEEPTYWNPEMGFWALSRFEDVLNGYRDWERFTSTQGIALGESGNISAPSMIGMDPPVQTKLRKLIVRAFTPKRMAAMEPRIRDLTTKFLDTFIEEGECDLIARFAALLPSDVISTLLGAPPEDHSNLRIWTAEMLTREDGVARPPPAAEQASANLVGRFHELIGEKRKRPGEDLISALIAAELEGERLTDEEILGFAMLLIAGGNETTEKLIANTVHQLARHAEQRSTVIADPRRIPAAVEESLRFRSPTQYMVRTTTCDVELHGRTIPKGEQVMLLIGAANHDPRRFDSPERFDIARVMEQHLAFGYGVHFCLGARLARLEARVALEEIHARMPDYEVDEAGISVVHATNVAGLATLPVRFSPSRPSGSGSSRN